MSTIPKEDFSLTEGERNSATWGKLERYLNHRLAAVRVRNDGPLTEQETAACRGEIKAIKALMDLGKPRPIVM